MAADRPSDPDGTAGAVSPGTGRPALGIAVVLVLIALAAACSGSPGRPYDELQSIALVPPDTPVLVFVFADG